MKKIVTDGATRIELEDDEAKEICRLRQGEECCAFLVVGPDGFECIRMSPAFSETIFARLEEGAMVATGRGEWPGCPWAKEEN